MTNEMAFYTTKDVRKILGIGNKTCLALFHRADFPCIKIGKSFLIDVEAFKKYISTRRVFNDEDDSKK